MKRRRGRLLPTLFRCCLAAALAQTACGPGESGRDAAPSSGRTSSPAPAEAPAQASTGHASDRAAGSPAPFPRIFTDITRSAGITFRHTTGGTGEKWLPETLGSGAAFLDFDGDGRLDIFFVDSAAFPGAPPAERAASGSRLYRNRGDGTFEDATAAAGAGVSVYGMGCAVADHDGDGDDDIYITAVGDNVLLENDGGRFRDATARAGVAGGRWLDSQGRAHPEWSTAAAWLDLERDGDLDLFVTNYVEWTPELDIFTTIDGTAKAFTTPDRYNGLPARLFRARGDGTYEDATEAAGISSLRGKSLGLAFWDFDGDAFLDIAVANDTRPNFLFLNEGGSRLREVGLEWGIAYDENGRARAGMGIDIAIPAGERAPAVVIGNFARESASFYRLRRPGEFEPAAEQAGIAQATYSPLAFGVLFADLDLDGRLDLVIANGHIEPEIARYDPAQTHAQPAQLFQGLEGGSFREVGAEAGPDFHRPRVGRGLASGDIDGDGDLDLLITTNGDSPTLLRNDAASGSPHFLRVRLRGADRNTAAIGAVLELESGGRTQRRLVRRGSSYLSESEITETLGLGDATSVSRLRVEWPRGGSEDFDVAGGVDRTIEVREEPRMRQ